MKATHLIIFNREPATADGWIHIVPKGDLPNRDAGIVQVLDDTALDSIMAGIKADATRLGNRWPGLYAGEEHFIYNDDKSSAAFAWFKDFEKRADGIWAKDDGLTDIGQEAIKNRRFKYTSFVADRRNTEALEGNRVRVLKIETVGFTNQANGKELLTPITNRNDFRHGLGAEADNTDANNKGTKRMKSVATKLGLSAEAAEEAVLAQLTMIMNRATELEGKLTPLTQRVTALEAENATLLGEQIDADFATAGIKDEKIINRHKPLLSDPKHFKNRADRVVFIQDLAKPGTAAGAGAQRKLMNRDATPPTGTAGAADERERVEKSEAAIQDYKIKNRCSYDSARNVVRRLQPALFTTTTENQ